MPDPAVALSVRPIPGHRYSACVTDGELLAEIERRIASTPWRVTFPLHRNDAMRLRLARAHLTDSVILRFLWPMAWAAGLSVVAAALTLVDAIPESDRGGDPSLIGYVAIYLGLAVAALGRWATTAAAALVCRDIAREMEALRAASDARTERVRQAEPDVAADPDRPRRAPEGSQPRRPRNDV